jgi:hypothetical protein
MSVTVSTATDASSAAAGHASCGLGAGASLVVLLQYRVFLEDGSRAFKQPLEAHVVLPAELAERN